ncbi:MAG: bifunctional 2-C-methyl-D-erythritol 4-phosphate cytidylyltransferase/2-C-methyl-D-erythritol 2,4-cyclodiphosphate synthase [Hyphomicrobiaceae bacterium]
MNDAGKKKIGALIVAAGRGERAGSVGPKQYVRLAGRTVLEHTLAVFLDHEAVDFVQVVIHDDDRASYDQATANLSPEKLLPPVSGGSTRQRSVMNGLEALTDSHIDGVLIHDGARPFVDAATIEEIIAKIAVGQAAIAAEPLVDTLKQTASDGEITATIPRKALWRAHTPQGFPFADILKAHQAADAARKDTFTDDASVAEWAGLSVHVVAGNVGNFKLTSPEDMIMAEQKLASIAQCSTPAMEPRVGNGFDVHKFGAGDHVWLAGVKIPHTHRLEGHSDADVVLHALTDAILGALGDGDIGAHFPPSDEKWRGAASDIFLQDAVSRVEKRGGRIAHLDATVLCEVPKIGPHRHAMREKISEICNLAIDRVGVKATTTEGLGFTGRREGISAIATATVMLPI